MIFVWPLISYVCHWPLYLKHKCGEKLHCRMSYCFDGASGGTTFAWCLLFIAGCVALQ